MTISLRTALYAFGAVLAAAGVGVAQTPTGFADMVERVAPAIVNVATTGNAQGPLFVGRENLPGTSGQGAGFLVRPDGLIVTNAHVVDGAERIQVETSNGRILDATLVGLDRLTDIALLDVEGDNHPTLSFTDSDRIRVGDWAIAVGNPLGQGFSVSLGIVSARGRTLAGALDDYIQTDAAINQGNSGGPLLDAGGQVMGVNTAILSPTGGSIGIGFAMAANVVQKTVEQIAAEGSTRRGWLGLQLAGTPAGDGATVTELLEGPAAKEGIQVGDVILEAEQTPVRGPNDITRLAAGSEPGRVLHLRIARGTETLDIHVRLERREDAETRETERARQTDEATFESLRFGYAEDSANGDVAVRDAYATTGLMAGDIVLLINQRPVFTPQEAAGALRQLADTGRGVALLSIVRGTHPAVITLTLR